MEKRIECEIKLYQKMKEIFLAYSKVYTQDSEFRMRAIFHNDHLTISAYDEVEHFHFLFSTNEECGKVYEGYDNLHYFDTNGKLTVENSETVKLEMNLYNKGKELWNIYNEYYNKEKCISFYVGKNGEHLEYFLSNFGDFYSNDHLSFFVESGKQTLTKFSMHDFNLDDMERMVKEIG